MGYTKVGQLRSKDIGSNAAGSAIGVGATVYAAKALTKVLTKKKEETVQEKSKKEAKARVKIRPGAKNPKSLTSTKRREKAKANLKR